MSKHYCAIHDTPYFKKGKMKGYAHPITDDDGENTGEWCNEAEQEEKTQATAKTGKEATARESPARQASIEAQNAYTGIVSLMGCGVINRDEGIAQTALNYAMSKLGHWSSLGKEVVPEKESKDEPMMTPEQGKAIWAIVKKNGYAQKNAMAIMMRLYQTSSSKNLTAKQAADFISVLEAKKYLDEDVTLEDVPF